MTENELGRVYVAETSPYIFNTKKVRGVCG